MLVHSWWLLSFWSLWCVVYRLSRTSRLLSAAIIKVYTWSPGDCAGVLFTWFLYYLFSQVFVELLALMPNTAVYGINQWGEVTVLNLHDPLIVVFLCSPFRALHKHLLLSCCFEKHCLFFWLWYRNMYFDCVSKIRMLANFVTCEAVYDLTVKRL